MMEHVKPQHSFSRVSPVLAKGEDADWVRTLRLVATPAAGTKTSPKVRTAHICHDSFTLVETVAEHCLCGLKYLLSLPLVVSLPENRNYIWHGPIPYPILTPARTLRGLCRVMTVRPISKMVGLEIQLKNKIIHQEHDTLLVVPGGLHRNSNSIKI